MAQISKDTTIGELLNVFPGAAPIFSKRGLIFAFDCGIIEHVVSTRAK